MATEEDIKIMNECFARLETMLASLIAASERGQQLGQSMSATPRIETITAPPTQTIDEQANNQLKSKPKQHNPSSIT
ncbi:hypothetical protein CROQUDRAFT_95919 [Cronartium quercuum f. sp. fusiforme G11]|uniref:Uncharacterized protein n=1 Tax=Cronartium quercuum f. sp. fusiforme G11 TaxID=708437 RepID=A0A9P6ND65_9BASI|nr:hypothetical protein CROQUDRAFT_95919 [Cronartium quercuum f. sp. fusiforme G11]